MRGSKETKNGGKVSIFRSNWKNINTNKLWITLPQYINQRLAELIKNEKTVCCLQEIHLKYMIGRSEEEDGEICDVNKLRTAVLIFDTVDFRAKKITGKRKGQNIYTKRVSPPGRNSNPKQCLLQSS